MFRLLHLTISYYFYIPCLYIPKTFNLFTLGNFSDFLLIWKKDTCKQIIFINSFLYTFLLYMWCIIIDCIRIFCNILWSAHFTFTLDNVIHSYDLYVYSLKMAVYQPKHVAITVILLYWYIPVQQVGILRFIVLPIVQKMYNIKRAVLFSNQVLTSAICGCENNITELQICIQRI